MDWDIFAHNQTWHFYTCMKSLFPIIPYENVMIAWDNFSGTVWVTVSSLNSWTPVNIDVWIHKLREIECEEVPMVYEIYENRLKEWCKFGYWPAGTR